MQISNSITHALKDQFSNWQTNPLKQYLTKVAALFQQFAGTRGGLFVRYAGLLHDLGKFQAAFQAYSRNVTGFKCENAHLEDPERPHAHKISHSTAGAKYAVSQNSEELYPFFAHLLAYLIVGHHAGLADWYDKGSLKHRLQNADKNSRIVWRVLHKIVQEMCLLPSITRN